MSTGAWVLVVAAVAALTLGLLNAARQGRFRGTHRVAGVESPAETTRPVDSVLAGTSYDGALGERATLLQFSSAFCAPCRATRRVLADVAEGREGVAHLEVDAESNLDLVRRLGVLRTPTTLVLDSHGQERVRAAGAPTRTQVLQALGDL